MFKVAPIVFALIISVLLKVEVSASINQFRNAYWFEIPLKSFQQDTCMIDGMCFEIIDNGENRGLKAGIKNGKIKIVDSKGDIKDFRVIRYVFSIHSDEKYSSVRHYGDLVSYPVIILLKESEPGEQFYFEDIIIVDPSKTIMTDAVKPLIIKRI